MTIAQQVETLFGSKALTYFKNKQKGGSSNQNGSRYEDFFSIMKLANLFRLLVTDSKNQNLEIHAQAEGFVDDLLIVDKSVNYHQYFQLKNTVNIDWGNGLKSISDDFHKQKLLDDDIGIKTTCVFLVCSDQSKVNLLKKKIPTHISDFSEVIFFPNSETVNQLILSHDEFRQSIANICFSTDTDKIEALAKIILGHWSDKKTTVFSVTALFLELQHHFPNYLADVRVIMELLPGVKSILSMIPHFEYVIENGYFSWDYGNGLDSGTLLYPVNSKEFNDFQQQIMTQQPTQFSELESILL
jgi:hypothetical protein